VNANGAAELEIAASSSFYLLSDHGLFVIVMVAVVALLKWQGMLMRRSGFMRPDLSQQGESCAQLPQAWTM
jgi:hypothetical protein